MTDWKDKVWPLFTQLLLILMGLVLLYLAVSFARQVRVSQQRRQEIGNLEGQIGVTLEERTTLERDLQQARSDTAVEEWARSQGWAKADEVIVVPVGARTAPSADGQAAPRPPTVPASPQQAWWNRFFGTR